MFRQMSRPLIFLARRLVASPSAHSSWNDMYYALARGL